VCDRVSSQLTLRRVVQAFEFRDLGRDGELDEERWDDELCLGFRVLG